MPEISSFAWEVEKVRVHVRTQVGRFEFPLEWMEDAVQEAFLRASPSESFLRARNGGGNEKAHEEFIRQLCVIARNYLFDQYRQSLRYGSWHGTKALWEPLDENWERRIETAHQVRAALARLKPKETELLQLQADGLTCEEISELWGQSLESVKKRLQRARNKFRVALKAEGYELPADSD